MTDQSGTGVAGAVARVFLYGAVVALSALLLVFVFSRLYGEDSKWLRIMADSYERSVKNFAEEGVELPGYTLVMLAAMEFLYVSWRHLRSGRS